jgi:hypothetical protein
MMIEPPAFLGEYPYFAALYNAMQLVIVGAGWEGGMADPETAEPIDVVAWYVVASTLVDAWQAIPPAGQQRWLDEHEAAGAVVSNACEVVAMFRGVVKEWGL